MDNTEMGLKLPISCIVPPLCIGITLPILNHQETPDINDRLKMSANGLARAYLASLITNGFNLRFC
jgi:hypothetical protein